MYVTGQPRVKATSTAVKSSAKAGVSQRRFSSDKSVRIFSLTPSVVNKKRNSPIKRNATQGSSLSPKVPTGKMITQATPVPKEKANGSKDNKNLGYRESALSQQEVLLAEGGSQKLSELLADDKLWEDLKS